jgi:hypothetical protein
MSQIYKSTNSGGGGVDEVTGTSPILANGVAGTPETGAVALSISLNPSEFTVNGSGQLSLVGGATAAIQTINSISPNASGDFGLLGTANQVAITGGTNDDTISLIGPYTPATYTAHSVILGEGTSSMVGVGPNATSGVPLISQGLSTDPTFGTAAIAGGGTNATSFTQSNGIVTYNGTSLVNYAGPQISSSGYMVNTSQPAFQVVVAGGAVTNVTGDGTFYEIIFNNVTFQNGSGYDTSTGIFTAPAAGKYLFSTHIDISNLSSIFTTGQVEIQTSQHTVVCNDCNPGAMFAVGTDGGRLGLSTTIILPMNVGDTARVGFLVGGGTKTVGITDGSNYDTWWSCALLPI